MRKHIFILGLIVISVLALIFIPKKKELELTNYELNMTKVEITGGINKPGFYYIPADSYLYDLIKLAGGLTPNAAVEEIYYQDKVNNSKIIIPTLKEESQIEYHETYNLNTVIYNELINISGITETRALNILLYRENKGTIYSVDELLNVKGIGDATYEKIKDYFFI